MFKLVFLFFVLLLCSWDDVSAAPYNPDWGSVGVFTNAQTCAGCHRASAIDEVPSVMRFPDAQGEDISPSYQWRHSMMAHAFNDPYYQAAIEDEATFFSGLAGLVEDTCLTCHSPMAHTNAHQTGTGLSQDASCTLPDGCYRLATASAQDHAREGVSCTLCHQIEDDNLGSPASFSGGFSIAAAGDADAFAIYGPYQNPHVGGAALMQSNTGYTPQFGNQMTSSAHCASCHTLFTPTLDADDDSPTGAEFLEQGAFLEWQNSIYVTGASEEQQCQDCHMPDPAPGTYSTRIALRPNGTVNSAWPERSPFFTHSMVGGNSHMLALLRDNRNALGIENSTTTSGFDEKISQTRALLENQAAALDITEISLSDGELAIDVRVTNKTGHKLPTGYPSRRVWIYLTVRDAIGEAIFESGAADAQGRISTDTARLTPECLAIRKPAEFSNRNCFEPHRDLIDDAAQIGIYEPVLGDSNDHITHILLHAGSYLKDNRIPPAGFTNSRATSIEPQTLPVGVDNDPDFNTTNGTQGSGSDTVHYRIAVNNTTGPYSVEARLLYQAISPSFVEGLHSTGVRVSDFKQMYAQNPSVIETLATASATASADVTPIAAVLPTSRSVQVGDSATAFATVINPLTITATSCGIAPPPGLPATFSYQTTDPATNALVGTPNTPVDIAPDSLQTFMFSFTPTDAFDPTDIELIFDCSNTSPAPSVTGLNTLWLSASNTPVPDIVALAATPTGDGIVTLAGSGAFAVATVNVGSSDTIAVSADTGNTTLPVSIALCETNPATGTCINPPAPTSGPVTTSIASGATPTFAFFVTSTGLVPLDPANNRIFVRFRDAVGVTRGSTSVAVRTQ